MNSPSFGEDETLTARSTAIAVTVAFALLCSCWMMLSNFAGFQAATLISGVGCLIAWLSYFSTKTKEDIANLLASQRRND